MTSPVETKLANLLLSLRETASTADQLANQVEAAILAMYEQELEDQPQPSGAMPQPIHPAMNPNIVSLVKGEKFEWDVSPENLVDLKDYCFIKVVSKNANNIGFKFLASTLGKVVITQHFDPAVHQLMEVGGCYVAHNVRKGRKLHWDMAMELEGEEYKAIGKAKQLARLFAEMK